MPTQLYLRDPFGSLQTIISNFSRLEYGRAENKVGFLTLDLDPNANPALLSLFRVDAILEPWRQVGANAPYLDGESVFFLRKKGRAIDGQGREVIRLTAYDANYLLDGHNAAYSAGAAQVTKASVALDNMMKAAVRENLGALATDTTRDLSARLTVQADLTLAPTSNKDFSRRQILTTLQEMANDSLQKGTYLAFDVVYVSPGVLEFRTYTGQRGVNHGRTSGNQVLISRERKNFELPELIEDHTEEYNYIYAGGQGVGSDRVICTATNAAAVGLSPWNRREKFIDARNTATTASVQAEADAGLQANRARKTLTGEIIDTAGCLDGVHYRWGDVVYAEAWGDGFDAHLNALHVTIENGRETRVNQIRGEAVV
jgi:hypothetical protein